MNTSLTERVTRPTEAARVAAGRKALRLGLRADWVDMLFVHYAFPPEALEPHVPVALDAHGGEAYVSLVTFCMNRLRPDGTGALGRGLFRAISDHPFLNLRTYVNGPAGPGIYFIAEWISNRLSLPLGPLVYGLPYRLARFSHEKHLPGGLNRVRARGHRENAETTFARPSRVDGFATATPGTRAHFLLERYTAYANARGVLRFFRVEHEPWRFAELDWIKVNTDLITTAFPWFAEGRLVGAHFSPGVENVWMGPAHRAEANA